jgi:hypothetical protein
VGDGLILSRLQAPVAAMAAEHGHHFNADKSHLLLSRARQRDDPVFQAAAAAGLTVHTDGMEIHGVPVGTDEFVEKWVAEKITDVLRDVGALQYFSSHGQWALLLYSINQRIAHLQRNIRIDVAQEQLRVFDDAITDTMLNIMGVAAAHRADVRGRVHQLRGLPLKLSGATLKHMARTSSRVEAVRLARDHVMRYVGEHQGEAMATQLKDLWDAELPVRRIAPTPDFDPTKCAPDDITAKALAGHVLGRIGGGDGSAAGAINANVPGAPDVAAQAKTTARGLIKDDAFAEDLLLHTEVLHQLNNSDKQHHTIVAAQVLSSSCVNTGHAVRWIPTRHLRVKDSQFQQILRLRMGVPPALPLAEWRCNCKRNHLAERDARIDGNIGDGIHGRVRFADEPFHVLSCRGPYRRVCNRHDKVRDTIIATLGKVPGITATPEPNAGLNNMRRADIRVTRGGNAWLLDVAIVVAATRTKVRAQHTNTVPGGAAKHYHAVKRRSYNGMGNLVPIVIEAGGRWHPKSSEFIDELLDPTVPDYKRWRSAVFRDVCSALTRYQSFMLAHRIHELQEARRQFHENAQHQRRRGDGRNVGQ